MAEAASPLTEGATPSRRSLAGVLRARRRSDENLGQGADGGAGAEWPKRPAQLRGPHPLGFLVKDRFPEFREMACKCNGMLPTLNGPPRRSHSLGGGSTYDLAARMMGKTTSMASGATASGTLGDGPHPGAFMRQFFQAVGEVQGHIARGRADVGKMAETVEVALAATSQAQEKEASDILGALTEEVSRSIGAAKEGLKILQERTDQEAKLRPSAQEVKIRNNMQHAMARKHQQLLLEFQRVQTDYKEGLKKRQCRELAILLPESSEKQREEMIQQGETASRVLVQKMAGAHATLIDEVNRIREKHQDILRLEQSIADIAQTFQEMAVLVDAQGEMLDSIEVNTRNVKAATAKAETNLKQTMKAQRKHRRYICCLMVVMIILALVIMLPVLAKAG